MYYKNKEIYKGMMKNKIKEGYGEMIEINGDKYIGEWKNDKREGKGKKIFRKGGEYEGIWKEDEILESNEMKEINDNYEYIGGFLNGKFNGK